MEIRAEISIGSLSKLITSPTAHAMHTHKFHIARPDVTLTKNRHVTTRTHRGEDDVFENCNCNQTRTIHNNSYKRRHYMEYIYKV